MPPPTRRCVLAVMLDHDKLGYDDADTVHGTMPRKTGTPIGDLGALKPRLTCGANIWAVDDIPYQDVIWTMDALVKAGLVDIEIGDPADPALRKPKPPTSPNAWHIEGDTRGKLDREELAKLPVIVITKTDVSIAGKPIGKAKDDFAAALAKAMPAKPPDYPTAILQADASLPFKAIRTAIAGAHAAGYDNILFAVKK